MQTQFGRKWFQLVVGKNESNQLSKTSCTSRKRSCTINVQIHLQMRSMQQMYFVNNHWSSCPGTLSCKVQKTSKNISIPHVIPPFCSKSRAVCKEDIVVTKFQLPHQVMQKRSTCVSTGVKLPYPTDLFVFVFEFATVGFHHCLLKICENMTSVRRCPTSVVR